MEASIYYPVTLALLSSAQTAPHFEPYYASTGATAALHFAKVHVSTIIPAILLLHSQPRETACLVCVVTMSMTCAVPANWVARAVGWWRVAPSIATAAAATTYAAATAANAASPAAAGNTHFE